MERVRTKDLVGVLAISVGCLLASTAAYATQITGSYTITETYSDTTNGSGGGPRITGDYGIISSIVNTSTGTSGNFSFPLTTSSIYTTAASLATFSPDGSCQGSGCPTPPGNIETDPINISFMFTSPSGVATMSDTGSFEAKYSDNDLSCDPGGTGGKSDCVLWNTSPIVANFSDDAVMDIELNNAQDWDITPTIQFKLVSGPDPVPEPSTMALFGAGILGVGLWRLWRQRQQTRAA